MVGAGAEVAELRDPGGTALTFVESGAAPAGQIRLLLCGGCEMLGT